MNFDNTQSHMPFLMLDSEGKRVLLFCMADGNNVWKLHVSVNDSVPQRIETGLPLDTIECSPTAWQDESSVARCTAVGATAPLPPTRSRCSLVSIDC